MHKKLGPLETWQWAAILAGLLLAYYEYEKHNANSTATTPPASSTDTSGAIDPTTGVPYADELNGTGGAIGSSGSTGSTGSSTDSGASLQQELSDLGAIEQLMSGLGLGTGGSTTNTTVASGLSGNQTKTLNADLNKLNKTIGKDQSTIGKLQKEIAKFTAGKRTTKHGGHRNPGHTITTHGDGRKSASSSAPHNARQHHNIAPPAHQRAHTPPYAIKPHAPARKKGRR